MGYTKVCGFEIIIDDPSIFPMPFFCKQPLFRFEENQAAGYHRHNFRPPILLKMSSERMKAVFFKKIFFFHHIFDFLQETSRRRWKSHFQKLSFDSQSTPNFPPLRNGIKMSFSKKPTFFIKKLLYVFDKSHCLSRILRQICAKGLLVNKWTEYR